MGLTVRGSVGDPISTRHTQAIGYIRVGNPPTQQGLLGEELGPTPTPSMVNLNALDLSSNLLQGQLVDLKAPISFLSVSNNNLTGAIPPSVCNFSFLQHLDLSNNSLSGNIPQCLGNSSVNLDFLDLRMNNLHGSIRSLTFPNNTDLKALLLNDNLLEGQLPPSLVGCGSLEVLDIGNNKILDSFPNWLGNLRTLAVLILRSNRFHGPIGNYSTRFRFAALKVLDLSHNNFSGPLPTSYFNNFEAMLRDYKDDVHVKYMESLGIYYSINLSIKGVETEMERILTTFTSIDLSNNLFEGEIPKVIGKLKSLKLLNFSHNSLTGAIPSSLRNLSQLESLDLSSNKFVGKIPTQLTSLTFLSVLNLSYNQLVGRIPQGKQFDTFQNDSYIGNSGLCGSPLSNNCSNDKAATSAPTIAQGEHKASSWFDWKIAMMGYGCGLVLGISMGYIVFSTGKPQWFMRLIERESPKKVRRMKRRHRGRRN